MVYLYVLREKHWCCCYVSSIDRTTQVQGAIAQVEGRLPEKLPVTMTAEDMIAAQQLSELGATGPQIMESLIHSKLDRDGVPRQGRTVTLVDGGWIVELDHDAQD